MSALQITAIVLCLIVPTVGWVLLFRQVYRYTALFRTGAPDHTRTGQPGRRTATLLREFLGHTRMARLPVVAIAHWFTALGFLILFTTLVNAFFQLVWPEFRLPIIGHFPPFEWVIEVFAWGCLIGILVLMAIRQKNHPRSAAGDHGRRSRFFGSVWWQAYFVEIIILLVSICILSLRSQEAALVRLTEPDTNVWLHFPLSAPLSGLWMSQSVTWIEQSIVLVAAIKILVSFTWMIVVSLTPTMGVAWHRFLAFFNIWFKRHADGRTSLGALQPMTVNGQAVTAENLEDLMEAAEEDAGDDDEATMTMGVGHVQDYTWKQLLDFSTCTECGRCQSQCPAWNTDKPLSPKMLMMTMRDHAEAVSPWLKATADERGALPEHTRQLATVPLVGDTGYEAEHPLGAYDALGPEAIIDSDVLWSCTTCGACVEQCPVDIEHVDAIVDMRRHQVLIESAFPTEFGGLFKNLESKQNPWGMAPKMRLDWAKGLEFDIPVVGSDVEDLSEVDYLFWVGCAGAFEDRAKKTTRAVAELLDEAGVSFAVLGETEACTGDSARRAGNEILYQMLAAQNIEMLDEVGAKKIVVTCAHCYNTLRNEYPQNGGTYEVLHHTQLLNRLVREKRLVPVARPEEHPGLSSAKNVASTAPSVTYHDPCYLGRHNNVYAPPRELIGALPGVELREMPRHGMKSFCCGAGGARMWAEENLGTRVNLNRTAEAVETGADRIAVGCPFCRVMLSDGLTAMQSDGEAREEVEVVDVAQMLLAAVRRGEEPDAAPDEDVDVTSAGEFGAAGGETPAEVEKEAKDEAAEGGSGEFEVDDETAEAAEQAREETAEQPVAETEAPAAAATEGKAKGKMSAADALAMMQAQGGGAAPAQESAPSQAQSPASEEAAPKAAAPKGKMSAADALAMMQAQGGQAETAPASSEAAPAAESPTTQAPPAEAPKAAMPKGKMSAAEALAAMGGAAGGAAGTAETGGAEASAPAKAPAAQQTATPAGTAPQASAPQGKPAEMPKGKMSAADALAMMQAQGGQTAPSAEPAPEAEPSAAAQAPAAPAEQPPVAAQAEPQAAQAPPAATSDKPAPARSSKPVEMPKGKMSAAEALAMMRASSPAPADEADTPATVAEEPAAPVETAEAPAAVEPQEAPAPKTESSATASPAAGTAPEAETTAPPSAPSTTASAKTTPAPAKAAPAKPVEMPKGRMSASEALAMMGGSSASTPAAEPAPEPPAAPQPEASTPPEPTTSSQPEAQPAVEAEQEGRAAVETETDDARDTDAAKAQDQAAEAAMTSTPATQDAPQVEASEQVDTPTQTAPEAEDEDEAPVAPTAEPATEPTAGAPRESAPETPSTATPAPAAGAWGKLVEAAGGKTIAASEAMRILGGN
ncbi:(Fe-S)-binding protein [Mobilicoccus massiliensis]|uniref:(Fe-S)-binding protein n=1 Tax=Mobilicoccus massiliensis TaxID=1522310 RepID=UPI000590E221|nr:(Fe-S)-binding protein [Mobilicoccus massiliensis]